MGDKGGGGASEKAAKLADKYWDYSRPVTGTYAKQAKKFMRGRFDPTQSPLYDAGRLGIEDQYGVARENILANMPTGGAMYSLLADTETNRANALTSLEAQIMEDEYNKAYGFATGAPQVSIGGLTSLAGSQAAANAQQQAGKFGALGELGSGLGMAYGMTK